RVAAAAHVKQAIATRRARRGGGWRRPPAADGGGPGLPSSPLGGRSSARARRAGRRAHAAPLGVHAPGFTRGTRVRPVRSGRCPIGGLRPGAVAAAACLLDTPAPPPGSKGGGLSGPHCSGISRVVGAVANTARVRRTALPPQA